MLGQNKSSGADFRIYTPSRSSGFKILSPAQTSSFSSSFTLGNMQPPVTKRREKSFKKPHLKG
jgi:hypothetical protein